MSLAAALRIAIWFAVALATQWFLGAHDSSASDDPDEPAHIVTGIMVREYLRSGIGQPPMAFAQDYYRHYPKVALGHWPPLFYMEQALWTLFTSPDRNWLLALIAVQTALLASGTQAFVQSVYGVSPGWVAGLFVVTSPGVLMYGSRIMTEIPLALLIFAAAVLYARYLETSASRHAAAFGLVASLCLLMKGSGLVLAGVPVISVVLMRDWRRFRSPSFWLPGVITLALATPWYRFAPGALHQKVSSFGGPRLATWRWELPPMVWTDTYGWSLAVLVALGLLRFAWRMRESKRASEREVVMVALVICATAFPMLFAVWERRHQTESTGAFVFLAISGGLWICSHIPQRLRGAVASVCVCALALYSVYHGPRQAPSPENLVVDAAVRGGYRAILVIGGSLSEGALISEFAQREPSPQRYILRSSKLLASTTWMGRIESERLAGATDTEVADFLKASPVDAIAVNRLQPSLLQSSIRMKNYLEDHPGSWRHESFNDISLYLAAAGPNRELTRLSTVVSEISADLP